jgi:hypothetical protein
MASVVTTSGVLRASSASAVDQEAQAWRMPKEAARPRAHQTLHDGGDSADAADPR